MNRNDLREMNVLFRLPTDINKTTLDIFKRRKAVIIVKSTEYVIWVPYKYIDEVECSLHNIGF